MGDFARVSAAQTPFWHERTKPKACTSHVAHLKFPIDQSCRAPIIAVRISLRDFIGHGASSCGCCLLSRRADQPPPCCCRRRVRSGNGHRYEQAAQAGDDDAQFILGRSIQQASVRPRSDQEAFRWFSRATDQGHSHAMLIVAGLYASGRGGTKDNVKAYSWAYIVASAAKSMRTATARQLMPLMKRMTSDEIGRAVVAARAWRAVRCWCGQVSAYRKSWRCGPTRGGGSATATGTPRSCSQRQQPSRRLYRRSRRHPPSRYCRHPKATSASASEECKER